MAYEAEYESERVAFERALGEDDMSYAFEMWNRCVVHAYACAHGQGGGNVTSSHLGHGAVVMEKADRVQEWKQVTVRGCAEEVEVVAKSAGWMVRQMNRISYVRDGVRIAR
eukprot:1673336-Alexandrium_andersonii.AAC.1